MNYREHREFFDRTNRIFFTGSLRDPKIISNIKFKILNSKYFLWLCGWNILKMMRNWKDFIIVILILVLILILIKESILIIRLTKSTFKIVDKLYKQSKLYEIELATHKKEGCENKIENIFEPDIKIKRILQKKKILEENIKEEFKYKLSAIITQEKEPNALLTDDKNNSIIVVKGDEVQGFVVEFIGKDYIRLRKGELRITLNLW